MIPTNLERKDPVMDAEQNILPDVSIPPSKPPGFDGYNYPFWKFKMENYIKANGLRIWDVIERGDNVPLDDEGFEKPRSSFTNDNYFKVELNHRAIHLIQCVLSQKEYFRISHHKTAKEMWEALETAHAGTSGVKDRKVEMLVEEFHKFTMLPDEPIRDLELRFTHLINNLASLGKTIPEKEQVNKILKVLKGDWLTKVTILQEVQGDSTRSVTALFGSLAEYEPTLLAQRAPQAAAKAKNIALVAPSKEKR